MLKAVLEAIKRLVGLAKDTQETKESLKLLQAKLEFHADTLTRVIFELKHLTDHVEHEREKTVLQIENAFLRNERALLVEEKTDQSRLTKLEEQVAALTQEVEMLKNRMDSIR